MTIAKNRSAYCSGLHQFTHWPIDDELTTATQLRASAERLLELGLLERAYMCSIWRLDTCYKASHADIVMFLKVVVLDWSLRSPSAQARTAWASACT